MPLKVYLRHFNWIHCILDQVLILYEAQISQVSGHPGLLGWWSNWWSYHSPLFSSSVVATLKLGHLLPLSPFVQFSCGCGSWHFLCIVNIMKSPIVSYSFVLFISPTSWVELLVVMDILAEKSFILLKDKCSWLNINGASSSRNSYTVGSCRFICAELVFLNVV